MNKILSEYLNNYSYYKKFTSKIVRHRQNEDVEDAMQNIYFKLSTKRIELVEIKKSIKGYILAAIKNVLFTDMKKQAKIDYYADIKECIEPGALDPYRAAGGNDDMVERIATGRILKETASFIKTLPKKQQTVINHWVNEEGRLSIGEESGGIVKSTYDSDYMTIKSNKRLAMGKLKQHLKLKGY